MIFGPDERLTKKIKEHALHSGKVGKEEVKKAIKVSLILKKVREGRDEEMQYRPTREQVEREGFTTGEQLFSVGTDTLLKMLELHTFTVRELASELDVSVGIARRWIEKVTELDILTQVEDRFGEQAYHVDEAALEEAIEAVKTALDELKRGGST